MAQNFLGHRWRTQQELVIRLHILITFVQESRMNTSAVKDAWSQIYGETGFDCHDFENKNKQTTASTKFFIVASALVRHKKNMVTRTKSGLGSPEFHTSHPLTLLKHFTNFIETWSVGF